MAVDHDLFRGMPIHSFSIGIPVMLYWEEGFFCLGKITEEEEEEEEGEEEEEEAEG